MKKLGKRPNPTVQRMIGRMDEIYPLSKATGILDNGCGTGAVISYIVDEFGQQLPSDAVILAGDFSEHMVKALTERQKTRVEEGSQIWARLQPRQLDAHNLTASIAPSSLSHIVASHVFFLLDDSKKALRESHLVLQSGGILAISHGYNSQHIDAIQDAVEYIRPGTNMKMIRQEWATEDATKEQLQECGFEDIEMFFVDSEMGYEKLGDFAGMLMNMPVMTNVTEDYSQEEKDKLVAKVGEILRGMNGDGPGKLKGRNLVTLARKA